MSPYIHVFLFFTMAFGTIITLTSSHWLTAWMGIEMSTLAFLPIMCHKPIPRAVEATTKYFMIQISAAGLMLFSAAINSWPTGSLDIQQAYQPLPLMALTLALALKLGLAPLHLWLPEVLQGLNLFTGLIMTTWQKIAPLCLIIQLHLPPKAIMMLGFMSILIGGLGGLNQTQLRKLLAYSSVAHLGWMMIILQFSMSLTLLTFFLYFIMTSAAFLVILPCSATNINSLTISWAKSLTTTIMIPLVFLSLGGLPPLTGFMPKWLILQELTKQNATLVAILMVPAALLSLYFYLRISYVAVLTTAPNNLIGTTTWRLTQSKTTMPVATCVILSLMLLPLTPTFLAFTP